MTLPPCAQDRDAMKAAWADFERYGADCDPRIVKQAVLDVLSEVRFRLAPAIPHGGYNSYPNCSFKSEFEHNMQVVIDEVKDAFDQAIEDDENPDTRAATRADMQRDMNR